MGALDLVSHWPAPQVAAVVVDPNGPGATTGPAAQQFRIASLSVGIAVGILTLVSLIRNLRKK